MFLGKNDIIAFVEEGEETQRKLSGGCMQTQGYIGFSGLDVSPTFCMGTDGIFIASDTFTWYAHDLQLVIKPKAGS